MIFLNKLILINHDLESLMIFRSQLSKNEKYGNAFFDMHMMVAHPDTWIEPMKDAGADQYTFHIEATNNPKETCRKIKESGMKVGIGIKPKTSIEVVEEYIEEADMILIMTVEPGKFYRISSLYFIHFLFYLTPGLDTL